MLINFEDKQASDDREPQDDDVPKLISLVKWRNCRNGHDRDESEDASDGNLLSDPSDPYDADEDNTQCDDNVGDHDTDSVRTLMTVEPRPCFMAKVTMMRMMTTMMRMMMTMMW